MCEFCPTKTNSSDMEVSSLLKRLEYADLSSTHIVQLMDKLLGTGYKDDSELESDWSKINE